MSRKNSPSSTSLTLFTVGFSSHRLETLPFARRGMAVHQAVVLEEPPSPTLSLVLDGSAPVEDYVMESESAFPEFVRQQTHLLMELHQAGIRILQIEPYLQRLEEIHDLLIQGRTPAEVSTLPHLTAVYGQERECTGALLDFYHQSLRAPFPQVVAAVQTFAQADARRFRLRDHLRAAALAQLAGQYEAIYVEAGYMHQVLPGELARRLGPSGRIRSYFLLEDVVGPQLGSPRPFGPGDVLTLKYLFAAPLAAAEADLLAARSLIYIKLISKEELVPGPASPYPHTTEEIAAARLVAPLGFADCEKIYALIKTSDPPNSLQHLRRYLQKYLGKVPD